MSLQAQGIIICKWIDIYMYTSILQSNVSVTLNFGNRDNSHLVSHITLPIWFELGSKWYWSFHWFSLNITKAATHQTHRVSSEYVAGLAKRISLTESEKYNFTATISLLTLITSSHVKAAVASCIGTWGSTTGWYTSGRRVVGTVSLMYFLLEV